MVVCRLLNTPSVVWGARDKKTCKCGPFSLNIIYYHYYFCKRSLSVQLHSKVQIGQSNAPLGSYGRYLSCIFVLFMPSPFVQVPTVLCATIWSEDGSLFLL